LLELFDGGVKRWSKYAIDNKAKVGGSAQGRWSQRTASPVAPREIVG